MGSWGRCDGLNKAPNLLLASGMLDNLSLTLLLILMFGFFPLKCGYTLTKKQKTGTLNRGANFWPNKSVDANLEGAKWRHYLCKCH